MADNAIKLSIGGIVIEIHSSINLSLSFANQEFLTSDYPGDIPIAVQVIFSDQIPDCKGECCGNDRMFQYYNDGLYQYMLARKGTRGSVSLAIFTSDFTTGELYINEGTFPDTVRTIDKVLQLLPMKQILSRHNVLMLHSSRIVTGDKSILFTAPSQTGKTTQARLWNQYEKARIVSNDRSLLRKIDSSYYTYGYPVDGSSPVYNNEPILLGAVVVLKQSSDNTIEKLSVKEAFKYLIEQTVAEIQNSEQRIHTMQLLLNLLNDYPVYLLKCRPDEDSVICLKQQLIRDGVIKIGFDS